MVVVGITFLALSSAPLLACMLAAAVILWERYTCRSIANRVAITLSILAVGYIIIGRFYNRLVIALLLPFISTGGWTAYYRLYIWEYAMMNIAEHLFSVSA